MGLLESIALGIAGLWVMFQVGEYRLETKDPGRWEQREHRQMMRECRKMCGKERVRAYDPTIGECTCTIQQSLRRK